MFWPKKSKKVSFIAGNVEYKNLKFRIHFFCKNRVFKVVNNQKTQKFANRKDENMEKNKTCVRTVNIEKW